MKLRTWVGLITLVLLMCTAEGVFAQSAVESASFKDVMVRQVGFKKVVEGNLKRMEAEMAQIQACQMQRKFWDGQTCNADHFFKDPVVVTQSRNVEVDVFSHSGACCRSRWGICKSTLKHSNIVCSETPGVNYSMYQSGGQNVVVVTNIICNAGPRTICPSN